MFASMRSSGSHTCLSSVFAIGLLAGMAGAQTPDTVRRASGATISGVVHDSLARGPLAGAMVQLVSADSAAHSARVVAADSLGRFAIPGVPDGRYMLGFFHPMLDSLGMEPPLREVVVAGQPVLTDLGTPSAARLRVALCGPASTTEPSAVVMGVARDAQLGAPAANVSVTGEWLEVSIARTGVLHRLAHVSATTAENGWFALCNVPSPGAMTLLASRGMDSTGRIEVQVPPEGFLRRELYLGRERGVSRLSGIVVTSADWTPLVGARVSISGGPRTVTNSRGEWTIPDAPAGTRMLQVLAVGYYPDRRGVDVVGGTPPVRVELSTVRAVLDTVKVTAMRLSAPNLAAFQQHQRTGVGRFITRDDIVRRQPLATTDLFRTLPGIAFDERTVADKFLKMRSAFGLCSPGVYIDDHFMIDLTIDDINAFVHPHEVAGIEIYTEGSAPAQYQRMDGCGSIVIWTK